MRRPTVFLTLAFALVLAACAGGEAEPEPTPEPTPAETSGVRVFFAEPADGSTVTSPFNVQMGAEGVEIVPAGEMRDGTGHFHILVDTDFVAPGSVIPNNEQHLHYGTGATETTLELEPGTYTLRLQLADGAHIALEGDEYRDTISVTVQ